MRYKWLVTNGDVGTDGNAIFYYSNHPNGRRALIKHIKAMSERTGKFSWAVPWPETYKEDPNRYYGQKPD
jgi:hypothetical protein